MLSRITRYLPYKKKKRTIVVTYHCSIVSIFFELVEHEITEGYLWYINCVIALHNACGRTETATKRATQIR